MAPQTDPHTHAGQWVDCSAPDGHRFAVWRSTPATGPVHGTVVVLQEIFGVNEHIRGVAGGYAAEGWVALAPAIFDRVESGVELGYDAAGVERGLAIARGGLDVELAVADIRATVASADGPVCLVGYCFGGLLAWLGACEIDGVVAASSYYGGGVAAQRDRTARCPVAFHFGAHDAHIPASDVAALRSAQPDAPIHVYDADHGFNCEARASHDARAAALARRRTLAQFRSAVEVAA